MTPTIVAASRIHDDASPDNGTIAAKAPLPVSITEHDVLWPVRNLIGSRQLPAGNGGTPKVCSTPSLIISDIHFLRLCQSSHVGLVH